MPRIPVGPRKRIELAVRLRTFLKVIGSPRCRVKLLRRKGVSSLGSQVDSKACKLMAVARPNPGVEPARLIRFK